MTRGTIWKWEEHLGNEVVRTQPGLRGGMWERNGSLRGKPEAEFKQVFLV